MFPLKTVIKSIFLLSYLFISQESYCTHLRAIDIRYSRITENKLKVQVYSYTKYRGDFDPDTITVFWGDNTSTFINGRINGPIVNGRRFGEFIGEPIDSVKLSIYEAEHTYVSAQNTYILSLEVSNRNAGICNIDKKNSEDLTAIILDTIFLRDFNVFGTNVGPVFKNHPVLYANGNDTLIHYPLGFDFDGDSISYELIVPLGRKESTQPIGNVPNYLFPNQVFPSASNNFSIDPKTGKITWAKVPLGSCPCEFNIAVKVTEWRKGIRMSTMMRDIQIIVHECVNNDPPQINAPMDTCIRVGDTLIINFSAFDPNIELGVPRDSVKLTLLGEPFSNFAPFATYTEFGGKNPVLGTFKWTPSCDYIRNREYDILIKAIDNYKVGKSLKYLTDEEIWKIRVIPAPPKNLKAIVKNKEIILSWDSVYSCFNHPNFKGFSVWRKKGCNPFTADYCQKGLEGKGYEKIAENIKTFTYTDLSAKIGQKYEYSIIANFDKKSAIGIIIEESVSPPSNVICVELKLTLPVLINVDITNTSETTGSIFVRWVRPMTDSSVFDTLKNKGNYTFKLFRAEAANGGNYQQIFSTQTDSFYKLIDTFFIDNNLNTEKKTYNYKVLFLFNNIDTAGYSDNSSSVFLTIIPKNESLLLNWTENVSWNNFEYDIYRKNFNQTVFSFIGVTKLHSFLDSGLINDSLYCYYVEAKGTYNSSFIIAPFINKSQINCNRPEDKIPPCPPTIIVTNECGKYLNKPWKNPVYTNYLSWKIEGDSICSEGVAKYYLYYAADSFNFIIIDSVLNPNIFNYEHVLPTNIAGCYKMTAKDFAGNTSLFSNIFCVENCPYYVLPNAFTPNGDGDNDLFTPFLPFRFVSKVEFSVFNRWGNRVFFTTDPMLNWDGKDEFSNKSLEEGVYVYSGYYYENSLNGTIKKLLPPNKGGGGYIHLIRGK